MAKSAVDRCLFISASLALRFRWQTVGKCNLGKRISSEAQGLFEIRENPAMADEKYFVHTNSSLFGTENTTPAFGCIIARNLGDCNS